jgi:uncharacterized protein with ParB-like and HNH nuclease domain
MSYIPKTISEVVSEYLNRTTFLPAIQREYVWGTYGIEKLFDSIMGDYLSSFGKSKKKTRKNGLHTSLLGTLILKHLTTKMRMWQG